VGACACVNISLTVISDASVRKDSPVVAHVENLGAQKSEAAEFLL